MALMRIRTIKPAFYKDEDLAELPPICRILFVGLWGIADSEGRLEYRPKYIKVEVLPYDDCDIPSMLESLQSGGFIHIYEVSGREYIQIPNFKKHQRIQGREADEKSVFPPPPTEKRVGKIRNNRETLGNNPEESGIKKFAGREGKGKEGNTEGKGDVAAEKPAALVPDRRAPPTHVQFVEGFQSVYEEMTGQPFKVDRKHWVIAANLVKANGYDPCVQKARVLGEMCRDRTAWFTKDGFASFTLETLSSKWNSIIPGGTPPTKEDEFIIELRKQEALRADFDRISATAK